MSTEVRLSPPWDTLWRKFVNTFGVDPEVKVGDLSQPPGSGNHYVIPIVVDSEKKGTALRTIIIYSFRLGNITVVTKVMNSKGDEYAALIPSDAQQVADTFTAALTGNPLFVETKLRNLPISSYVEVFVIFTKTIVQFFNDDLSDYYSNYNGVTAHVFSELGNSSFVNNTVAVYTSTAPSKEPV